MARRKAKAQEVDPEVQALWDPEAIWYRHSNGTEFGVVPGSELHKRAVEDGEIYRIEKPGGPAILEPDDEEEEEEPEEPESPLDGTVEEVEAYLATVSSEDELDSLEEAEKADSDRVGVLSAIEARREELRA